VGGPELKYRAARGDLHERIDMSNIISYFVVGRPKSKEGSPMAVY